MALGSQNNDDNAARAGTGRPSLFQAAVGYAIVAIFLCLCGYYVAAHWGEFAFLGRVALPEIAIAGVFIALSFLLSSYQLGLFLRSFGLRLGVVELTALTVGMMLGNLVTPMRGGTAALAVYLKKVHALDFRAFVVIYGGMSLLIALINAGLALLGLVLLFLSHGFFRPALTALVVGLFVVCLYLSVFPPPATWKRGGFLGLVFDTVHSWHLLTRDRGLLLRLTISLTVVAFCLAAAFYFIYLALGAPLSALAVLITSGLGNIANLAPITPGALGIFDAVVIEVPQLFGLDPARSLAAALVFRALSFFWACILGIPGLLFIVRLSRKRL